MPLFPSQPNTPGPAARPTWLGRRSGWRSTRRRCRCSRASRTRQARRRWRLAGLPWPSPIAGPPAPCLPSAAGRRCWPPPRSGGEIGRGRSRRRRRQGPRPPPSRRRCAPAGPGGDHGAARSVRAPQGRLRARLRREGPEDRIRPFPLAKPAPRGFAYGFFWSFSPAACRPHRPGRSPAGCPPAVAPLPPRRHRPGWGRRSAG